MPKLIFLGTSNAIPDLQHENTHLALVGEKRLLMIDCVSNPIVRLSQAGLNVNDLTDLVLTHFHPDHVSGVPLLLMNSWLLGRTKPLHIYGLRYTLERIEKLMDFYEWSSWPGFYPVEFHAVAEKELSLVLDYPEFRLYTSPGLSYGALHRPAHRIPRLRPGGSLFVRHSALPAGRQAGSRG